MCKFLYNIIVSAAYALGLFFFIIRGVSQEVWVIFFLVSGLFLFCFIIPLKSKFKKDV